MDYSHILQALQQATSFDLYRLKVAIDQQLENPQRTTAMRNRLKPGQVISYFDSTENRLIEATVLELRRTRILVQNTHDKAKWTIPFYMVNLEEVETDISVPTQRGVDKSQLKVGDAVVFPDKQNNDIHGEVIRLNRKTATIIADTGAKWRVGYGLISLVIDGERASPKLIEGKSTTIVENP